jgi:uncharacterized lipoprotein NlpE involved in copper resistance
MKYLITSLCLIGTLSACNQQKESVSQEKETSEQTQSAQTGDAVEQLFQQKYPEAENVSWQTDNNGYREAEFELAGEKYRADFTTDGQWVETERSLDYEDLPSSVQQAIENEFHKEDIAEIEQVDNKDKGKFYDVEFKQKGKNEDVEFREDGSRL